MAGRNFGGMHVEINGGHRYLRLPGRAFHEIDVDLTVAVPIVSAELPPLTVGFSGRDAEMMAIERLLDPGSAERVLMMAGQAGVGKTTLAVHAGHAARQRGWFTGGVLFIDLHGYDESQVDSAQALNTLLRAFGVPAESLPSRAEARAQLYRSILAAMTKPLLLIADNVSSGLQVQPLVPNTGPHKLIVTCRQMLAGLEAPLNEVKALDDSAGVNLMDAVLRTARPDDRRIRDDHAAARRLARICGGLPLALRIAAALLDSDSRRRTSDLVDDLVTERRRLEQLEYGYQIERSIRSVAVAVELSCRELDDEWVRVFFLMPLDAGPQWSTAAVANLAGVPISRVEVILAGLAKAKLIEPVSLMSGRWFMHDLLRLSAKQFAKVNSDSDRIEEARDRLLAYYLYVASAADHHLRGQSGTVVADPFSNELEAAAWLDMERPNLLASVKMAAYTGRDQAAMNLPIVLSQYLYWRRQFDDLLVTMAISVVAARQRDDRSNEATALTTLGVALQEVGRFDDAVGAHRDAAMAFREAGDRQGEGETLTNLALAFQKAGRFEDVIGVEEDAAVIFRETGDPRGEGGALNTLGLALRRLGRLDSAIRVHRDAVVIFREAGDRHGEARALTNLGLALHEAGRFEDAVAAQQDAVVIFREAGDRHGEATALTNLGLALHEAGRYEDAVAAQQEALDIFREAGDRQAEGIALGNLKIAQASLENLRDG